MYLPSEPTPTAVADQFRRAGFASLTALQRRLIPLVLRGRDVAAETDAASGKIAAAVYCLVVGHRAAVPPAVAAERSGDGSAPEARAAAPRAIVIAADTEEVAQLTREWARFARALGRAPAFVAVGDSDDVRREQRRLGDGVTVVVSTADRLIDHLRRGSLLLAGLETLVISVPEEAHREVFVRDVQWVLEKAPARRQTVVLGRPPLLERPELVGLAHRPQLIAARELAVAAPRRGWVAVDGAAKTEALVRLLLARPLIPVLVLHTGRTSAEKVVRRLAELDLRTAWVQQGAAVPARRRLASSLDAGELDVLLAQYPLAEEIDPNRAATTVWMDLPQVRDLKRVVPSRGPLVAFVAPGQERELARLQETMGATLDQEELPAASDVAGGAVDALLRRMAAADPAELARLSAVVRRRVPLLKRLRFAAFLLQTRLPVAGARAAVGRAAAAPPARPVEAPPVRQEPAQPGRSATAAQQKPRGRGDARGEARAEARGEARGGGTAAGYTQLFVSAGRNRRVHARDLVQLFRDRLALPEGRLGAVRVFEKYSFVEVPTSLASDAVTRLNGQEFAGRPLTVEVAKRHEGEPGRA